MGRASPLVLNLVTAVEWLVNKGACYTLFMSFFFFGTLHPSLLSAVLRVRCPADTSAVVPQTLHPLPTKDRTLIRY